MDIPLSKAPRILFDHDKWTEYVDHFDTEEAALMHLSSPPGIDFSWWKDPLKPDETVRVHKEKLFRLKMALVQTLYKRIQNKTLIASGRAFNAVERTRIPANKWRWLWPAWASDRVIGPDAEYSEVLLSASEKSISRNTELTERCEDYLRARHTAGKVPKKEILRRQLDEHFQIKMPFRVFNKAYTNIFSRTRGRPPK